MLRVFDRDSGRLLDSKRLGEARLLAVAAVKGNAFVGAEDGAIYKVGFGLDGNIVKLRQADNDPKRSLATDAEGRLLMIGAASGRVELLNLDNLAEVRSLKAHSSGVRSCTLVHLDSDIAAYSCSEDGTVAGFFSREGKMVQQSLTIPAWVIDSSAVGGLVAVGQDDGGVTLLRLGDLSVVRKLPAHSDLVGGCSFSPNGRLLLTTSFDRTIRLWNVESEGRLASLRVEGVPQQCLWDEGTGRIVVFGLDGPYFFAIA
jgi:WD40 repeat protein